MRSIEFREANIHIKHDGIENSSFNAHVTLDEDQDTKTVIMCYELTEKELKKLSETKKIWHTYINSEKGNYKEVEISVHKPNHIDDIDIIIAEAFNVTTDDLKNITRFRECTEARHFAMWYRREKFKDTFNTIGHIYDRDYSSVIYACKTADALLRTDKKFRFKAQLALEKLKEKHG